MTVRRRPNKYKPPAKGIQRLIAGFSPPRMVWDKAHQNKFLRRYKFHLGKVIPFIEGIMSRREQLRHIRVRENAIDRWEKHQAMSRDIYAEGPVRYEANLVESIIDQTVRELEQEWGFSHEKARDEALRLLRTGYTISESFLDTAKKRMASFGSQSPTNAALLTQWEAEVKTLREKRKPHFPYSEIRKAGVILYRIAEHNFRSGKRGKHAHQN